MKISIKNGNYRDYNLALQCAREKNKKLHYGNDEKNWNRKEYERIRRNLIYETRTGKIPKEKIETLKLEEQKIITIHKSRWIITDHGIQLQQ